MKMRFRLQRLPVVLVSISLLLGTGPLLAAPEGDDSAESGDKAGKKKVAVGAFDGPKAKQVRGWVLGVLKEGDYEVTDAEDVKGGQSDSAYAEAAKGLGVDAIVVGTVTKGSNVTLTIHNAADGAALGELELKGGNQNKLKKAIQNELAISIADPLSQAKAAEAEKEEAPAEEEAGQEEAAEEDAPAEPAEEASSGGPSPLELMAGVRFYNRNFEYTQQLSEFAPVDPLYTYELPLGPAVFADLRLYPAAFFSDGIASHIGVQLRFEQGFATRSLFAEGTPEELELETSMQELRAGLRGRIPFDTHEVGLFGEYGIHKFRLSGDETNPLVPDITYNFLRFGLDGRFRFGSFLVGLQAAPRVLLSMDELDLEGVWFPGATGRGLDFGASVGYAVMPMLDIIVGGDYVRYGFDFNAIPDDNPVVAGGATDTYISGYLAVGFHLPGSGSSSGSPDGASASVSLGDDE